MGKAGPSSETGSNTTGSISTVLWLIIFLTSLSIFILSIFDITRVISTMPNQSILRVGSFVATCVTAFVGVLSYRNKKRHETHYHLYDANTLNGRIFKSGSGTQKAVGSELAEANKYDQQTITEYIDKVTQKENPSVNEYTSNTSNNAEGNLSAEDYRALGIRSNWERAKKIFQKGIQEHSDSSDLFNEYAWALYNQGKNGSAEELAKRSIELDGSNEMAHHTYGRLLEEKGELNECMKHYSMSININAYKFIYNWDYTRVAYKQGRVAESLLGFFKSLITFLLPN